MPSRGRGLFHFLELVRLQCTHLPMHSFQRLWLNSSHKTMQEAKVLLGVPTDFITYDDFVLHYNFLEENWRPLSTGYRGFNSCGQGSFISAWCPLGAGWCYVRTGKPRGLSFGPWICRAKMGLIEYC